MRESRFFTPPEVPRVNLHVTSLVGGGACPAQYWGETPDGRKVYIRYRGGYLSIHVGGEDEAEAAAGEKVLDLRLGPPLDGHLSLEQFIRLTGLEVDEIKAGAMSERERDLSGATTFWNALSLNATKSGAEAFLLRLWRTFPDSTMNEVSWTHAEGFKQRSLAPGKVPSENVLEICLGRHCPKIGLQYSGFRFDFPGYGAPDQDARWSERAGRPVETSGTRGCEVKHQMMSLSAEFPAGDAAARDWLERLGEIVDAGFPVTAYDAYDLVSGQKADVEPLRIPDDPAIGEGVRAAPHRFRHVTGGGRTGMPLTEFR